VTQPGVLFTDISMPAEVQKALASMKFTNATEIQSEAIPLAMEGKDMIGCAATGTGKTAAYTIPMIAKLLENPTMTALVLVPTRELAQQVSDVVRDLTQATRAVPQVVLIGGAPMRPQIMALQRRPRIIVATPGRLMDHLRSRRVSLDKVEFLVLDEADRMLDMGFEPQLQEILKHVPKKRQTLLFSATLPGNIEKLAAQYLNEPKRITIGVISKPAAKIKQSAIETHRSEKNTVLVAELNKREGAIIVFVKTKFGTDEVAEHLHDEGFSVTLIHGDRSQAQRGRAIEGFRAGKYRVLVATDVAARGLDIPAIRHVINYDLPMSSEDYVHRIGRTARAGAEGEAVSLITPADRGAWRRISRLMNPDYQNDRPSDGRSPYGYNQRPGQARFFHGRRDDDRRGGGRFDRGGDRGERPRFEPPRFEGQPRPEGARPDAPRQEVRAEAPRVERTERPGFDATDRSGPRFGGPRNNDRFSDGPRQERPRFGGPREDRPRFDGPREGGFRSNDRFGGPRNDGPRNDRPRFSGPPRSAFGDAPQRAERRFDGPRDGGGFRGGNDRFNDNGPRAERPRFDGPRENSGFRSNDRFADAPRAERPRFGGPREDRPAAGGFEKKKSGGFRGRPGSFKAADRT
jgi:superfamily II DNA/RNA helicase